MGFISGTNWVKDRQTPVDAAAYRQWVRDYCERNPFHPLTKALDELDKQFGPADARVIPPVLKNRRRSIQQNARGELSPGGVAPVSSYPFRKLTSIVPSGDMSQYFGCLGATRPSS